MFSFKMKGFPRSFSRHVLPSLTLVRRKSYSREIFSAKLDKNLPNRDFSQIATLISEFDNLKRKNLHKNKKFSFSKKEILIFQQISISSVALL